MTRANERGTMMLETLIAFVPLFTLFLGIVQYTLLAAAQLVVQHAAVAGVRSASVVLDDDPVHYDGAARLSIAGGVSTTRTLANIASAVLSAVPNPPEAPPGLLDIVARSEGPRVTPIRTAVYAKLAAIVPARALATLLDAPGVSVLDALGSSPVLRLLQAPLYLPVTTAVTFPREPGSAELFDDLVDPESTLTIRVTHAVTCTIPLVSAWMCSKLQTHEGDELLLAPAASFQERLRAAGARVVVLRAEASMRLQKAPYAYAQPNQGSATP